MDGEFGGMGTFPPGTPEWVRGGCSGYNDMDPQTYVDTWLSYATGAPSSMRRVSIPVAGAGPVRTHKHVT